MPVGERLQEDAVGLFEDGDFVLRELLNTLKTLGGAVGSFRGTQSAVLMGLEFFFSKVECHKVGIMWMCFQCSRRENLSFRYCHTIHKEIICRWGPSSPSSSTGQDTILCRSCCWSHLVQPSHPSSILSLCSSLWQ